MDDDVYEVEQILNERLNQDHNPPRIEYFIKWKGYESDKNSWEPAENILCGSIFQEWIKKAYTPNSKFPIFSNGSYNFTNIVTQSTSPNGVAFQTLSRPQPSTSTRTRTTETSNSPNESERINTLPEVTSPPNLGFQSSNDSGPSTSPPASISINTAQSPTSVDMNSGIKSQSLAAPQIDLPIDIFSIESFLKSTESSKTFFSSNRSTN